MVQLLTELGLNTGYSNSKEGIHAECNAGMEWPVENIFKKTAPYVVKSPAVSEHIGKILETPHVVIDFMIIPVRDLYSAAESRRLNARKAGNVKTAGGLWLTKSPDKQEAALAQQFHHLVHTLVQHDVPMIWLHFPRLVKDPEYLYDKLKPALQGKDHAAFTRAFRAVSRPELVHDFKQKAEAPKPLLKRLDAWVRS